MKFTAVTKLEPGMMLGQSLIGISNAENYTLGRILTEDDLHFFQEKGLPGIYTLEPQPAQILSPELMTNCIQAINQSDIDAIILLSSQIVNELTSRPINLDFRSIRSFDDYLPHHSVCVAVYAVAIGIQLGMGELQLNLLAQAGLLHDIGHIPQRHSVLIKKETLSSSEFEELKRHPQDGCDILTQYNNISALVKDAVLHHHENINGTGYPDKLIGNSISLLAKILHVVDVYDAIMSKRPYKPGMSSADAINYLLGGKMILFDEQIVDKFLEIAIKYPTGSTVLLSNNEIVTVIGQTYDHSRPIVLSDSKQGIINLATDANYKNIYIINDIEYDSGSTTNNVNEIVTNSNTTGRKKLLIVDDVFVSIAHTKLALEQYYDVITCLSGPQALQTVKTEKPDLILMDYEMPEMDGITTVNELHKAGYHIPVIFLTGKCDEDIVRKCVQCGAVDYILKPANPVYLRTRVHMALHPVDVNSFV